MRIRAACFHPLLQIPDRRVQSRDEKPVRIAGLRLSHRDHRIPAAEQGFCFKLPGKRDR
ncbi:hypothetical protein [Rhizobium metallidurans]|uniref:hypothetical protein n=1 Tax=Rhizobium metallidurans TaxID=1265931 RepID=UPI001AEDE0CB|nr:hypothetical protein [Rhizobium metallidurans]